MMPTKFAIAAMVVCGMIATPLVADVYQEAGGYVLMEMENTKSDYSQCWTVETEKNPEGGKALRQAKCNNPSTGAAKNPLKYSFKINSGGVYTLYLKIWKDFAKTNDKEDKSNDVYVRVAGDFTTGGSASTAALKQDQKHYGGEGDHYAWSFGRLDYDHKKWDNKYTFKSGESYDLFISARAQNTVVDRILFTTSAGEAKGKADGTPESSNGNNPTSMLPPAQSHLSTPKLVAHRGSQSIRFEVTEFDASVEKAAVMVIYDLRGNAIKQLSTGTNSFSWDKTDFGGNPAPNGMYISVLKLDNTSISQSFLSF